MELQMERWRICVETPPGINMWVVIIKLLFDWHYRKRAQLQIIITRLCMYVYGIADGALKNLCWDTTWNSDVSCNNQIELKLCTWNITFFDSFGLSCFVPNIDYSSRTLYSRHVNCMVPFTDILGEPIFVLSLKIIQRQWTYVFRWLYNTCIDKEAKRNNWVTISM